MPLLTVTDAQLAFGHVALLDHIEFSIDAGERVALIGRNGTGKSSLLRAIAGEIALDDGQMARASGLRTATVPQEPVFDADHTVYEAVAAGLPGDAAVLGEYERIAARLGGERLPADEEHALLDRMQHLQAKLDAADGWTLKSRVDRAVTRLALNPDAPVSALSGGTQKRVALARALVAEPDLLLLDEPTNHLDIDAIEWLEELLLAHRGAVLFITHDRRFLDRVATRIVELDRGVLRSYPGAWQAYQARKAEELSAEALANARADKMLAQEEIWIRKGVEARRTRSVGRVARLQQLRAERRERRERQGDVRLNVDAGEKSGKLVAELKDVSKRFGERPIVRDFSTIVQRGDRIGLVGPNGAGKTTLLRLILGEIEPDAGTVRLGTKMEVAYFDQMRAQLDPEATLADTISPGSEWIEVGNERKHVMSYLSDFLFAPERARSPVRTLSGGERNRLLLARLFARPANVLVLDEPTNDLDIDTLELLEELLEGYTGTLFLVSHDRVFLDNVVTQTIVAEGEARWSEYVGGWTDMEAQRARQPGRAGALAPVPLAANAPAQAPGPEVSSVPLQAPMAAPKRKLSYKEQRELDALPGRIEALEAEQAEVAGKLADAGVYQRDPGAAQALVKRAAEIEEALLACLERWEALGG